jgi:hypothetical protein
VPDPRSDSNSISGTVVLPDTDLGGPAPAGPIREANPARPRPRLVSTLMILAMATATLGVLSVVSYCVGRGTESDLRFLEPRRPPTEDEACIAYPIEYSLRSNEKNDVIFLGDSTCRAGIDPAEFERLTGLRAYNLGSQGKAGAMAFVLTVKAYLSKHPRPQMVILSISPLVCELDGDRRDAKMRDRLLANYGPEVTGLIPLSESLSYFIKRGSLAAWAAPSSLIAGHHDDVRDLTLVGNAPYTYHTLERKIRETRGFGSFPGLHHHAGAPIIARVPERVIVRDDWQSGVRLLAETCQTAGVPFLFRFSPMPSQCSKWRDYSSVEQWSRDLKSSCPELIVGRPTLLWYDWNLCWDAYHLNAQGVVEYTAALANDVRAALASSGLRKSE